ncbi:ribose transport system substrate-binding protein [Lachnospiraceae bacterium PM6-15]|uniref:Substrate-binding domain-containing protein n=1 Tax=Ohessyouella blattaphilus TaxID=2949333 RepID=A0ABT1ELV8_9FIRM|nr:substrate-binding domain-containing protein [Ohessyouella blattaphilus]MCP1110686.1 substrate-binding domain-containing protein [Ohessyouella blattaphilus]MCR8564080.1 substrate-binding domain-containing protein [Ohessyouella blattaphilus]
MKKRVVASLMCVVLMMSLLIGCGQNSDSSDDAGKESPQTETASSSKASTGEILSTSPNGEVATPASELELTEEEKAQVREGNYTAAVALHYGGNDWSTSQVKGLTDTFAELGIKIVATTDANFSAEQQVSDIETIMAKKPDILVSLPTDATATADAYKKAAESGIKIVFMDNIAKGMKAGSDYVSCVSADNYGNGLIAADLIGEKLGGKGKVGVIYYEADYFVTNQRLEAFEAQMAEQYPDIEIVSKLGFTDENGCAEIADAMLTQNPNIEAIFAHWDIPAEGVLSALRAAGREDVYLSTIDLGNNIAKEIAEGNVLGVGAQLPYDQGVAEATLAAYALLGKETPPYVAVAAKRVEKSNILEGYTDVFHVEAPDWLKDAAK